MSPARATLTGFGAVLLWASLALFTVGADGVPPLQLNAMCFTIATGIGLIRALTGPGLPSLHAIPPAAIAVGVGGLFGFHFLYFTALSLAPPAEANLLNYLWPLLIVLFSGLLPGERLRPAHILGALVAFAGAGVLLGPKAGTLAAENWLGYAAAMASALFWAGYSVLSRRFGSVPSSAVTLFCLGAAILSWAAHLGLETTRWPATPLAWGSVAALGLGPVGLAFFLWDIGVKGGNIQLLGVLAYAAPVLSTLLLVATGMADPDAGLGVATVLITAGAAIAGLTRRG